MSAVCVRVYQEVGYITMSIVAENNLCQEPKYVGGGLHKHSPSTVQHDLQSVVPFLEYIGCGPSILVSLSGSIFIGLLPCKEYIIARRTNNALTCRLSSWIRSSTQTRQRMTFSVKIRGQLINEPLMNHAHPTKSTNSIPDEPENRDIEEIRRSHSKSCNLSD